MEKEKAKGGTVSKELLDQVVQRIVSVAKPERIILFGSAARGELTADSDLDFLVVKSGSFKRRALAQEIYMNLFGMGIPVDIVIATPEEIEQYRGRVGGVIGPALQEGREVYRETRPC